MRISDWSSDVCSSDLLVIPSASREFAHALTQSFDGINHATQALRQGKRRTVLTVHSYTNSLIRWLIPKLPSFQAQYPDIDRSEENTSDLQSLMRTSYAVFCLKTKRPANLHTNHIII